MTSDLNNATHYHYGEFPPKKLNYDKFINTLLQAADAVARYDQMLKNMHNSEILLAPLRNQEAVISSRMEGTISTIDEILKYEADYEDQNILGTKSDVIETILYQRTLKHIQSDLSKGYPFSPALIKKAHQSLLYFGRGAQKSPGEYKNEQNYLADKIKKKILFVPIKPTSLQEGLDKLFDYIENSNHPPLIKIAITHAEFEALHPFKDGNGRIGRMLITLMLWQLGLISAPHFYISAYFEEYKDTYIDKLREVSASTDWDGWCEFFLEATKQQAIRNLEVAESIRDLYEEMKKVFSQLLSSKWSIQALDFVFTNPFFRNNKFVHKNGIPPATAYKFTKILLENNILKVVEEASGRRSAMYSFEALLEKVRV